MWFPFGIVMNNTTTICTTTTTITTTTTTTTSTTTTTRSSGLLPISDCRKSVLKIHKIKIYTNTT